MALACRPHLVVADEPTTALDVMVQAQVLDLLTGLVRQLRRRRPDDQPRPVRPRQPCDRVAVMYAGRIVEEGPARDVFERPVHPYTRALSGAFPTIGDQSSRFAPRGLPGDPPFATDLPRAARSTRAARVRDRRLHADRRTAGDRGAGPQSRVPAGHVAHSVRCDGGREDGMTTATDRRRRRGRHRTPHPSRSSRSADLHVTFRTRGGVPARAVDGVNLAIGQGEIIALAGESGCGKTTLARAILGLERPSAGRGALPRPGPRVRRAGAEGVPPRGSAGPAGPDRLAQPQAHRLRGRGRGPAGPQGARQRAGAGGRGAVPSRATAAGAVLPPLPARAVRWPAAASRHRRCAGPRTPR